MRLRRKIREVTYNFEDLRDLLAKASPYRSGDALAGIAAESEEQRAAAQMTLADLPLRAFLQHALIPYEKDEVTRLIADSHNPVRLCSGRRRSRWESFATGCSPMRRPARRWPRWARSDSGDGRGGQQVDAGQDLILVARKIRVVTQFRTTVGLPGRFSTRLQPNHPGRRSRRHRRRHGRWAAAGFRGCGDRDQSRV